LTLLCVSIFVESIDQARRDIARAIEAGAEIVELRLDRLTETEDLPRLVAGFSGRFLFTCRPFWEGGESMLDDEGRRVILEAARAAHPMSAVDIEFNALKDSPKLHNDLAPTRIVSYHDFESRPADLTKRFVAMQESDAEVVKLAWTARSLRDNAEAFELMKSGAKPTIAICMGEAGQISRILAKKFRAYLSFASLDRESSTAPGQVTIDDMKRIYRWDSIKPKTKVFGVIGSPVSHSMSPAVHNAAFESIGFDGVYVPFLVNEGYESFKAFMETFVSDEFDLCGLSITLPHKENALQYALEKRWKVDKEARRIGALNTFVGPNSKRSKKWNAFNSDSSAIIGTICAALGIEASDLSKRSIGVIGAGGTGRTAVAALSALRCSISIFNRAPDRAEKIASEFGSKKVRIEAQSIESLADSSLDVYINTTSIGMSPSVDASPFDFGIPRMNSNTLVFDSVYNPLETKLIRQARESGAKTVGGIEMFLRQAAMQFEAWTGQPAPIEVMRRVILERLSK